MTKVPKLIHYCWFSNNQKPHSVIQFIDNWKSMLPDYEIKEWNESNFDIHCCEYVRQAYQEKKYAFVSDYARLHALYNLGGIYLDTDVEVVKSLEPLLTDHVVLGFEEFNYIATSTIIAPKHSKFIKDFMDSYHSRSFYKENGELDQTTNVQKLTKILDSCGLIRNNQEQLLNYYDEKILILDQLKLSPMDYPNSINKADETTYTIHHFGQTWASNKIKTKKILKKIILIIIGGKGLKYFRRYAKGNTE